MGRLIQIVLIVAVVYITYRIIRGSLGGGFRPARNEFQCATCKNCGKLFDDGVLCQFEGRETFKNLTHISNCIDHERR